MTEEQIVRLADTVLRDKLKTVGYESVAVRLEDDNDGDPAIYIDANLAPDTPLVDPKIYMDALSTLRDELIYNGERRFPYLYTKHPDDLYAYDVDPQPGEKAGS
jgi:hypothetical protein